MILLTPQIVALACCLCSIGGHAAELREFQHTTRREIHWSASVGARGFSKGAVLRTEGRDVGPALAELHVEQTSSMRIANEQKGNWSLLGFTSTSTSHPSSIAAATSDAQQLAAAAKSCSGDSVTKGFMPYVGFIVKHMAKLDLNTGLHALTETEKPMGDGSTWFWTDDNGKALEVLSQPAFFEQPEVRTLARDLSNFILRNSPEPFIFRRRMLPFLKVKSSDPNNVNLNTAGLWFGADKRTARVKQAILFHDGRQHNSDLEHGEHHVTLTLPGSSPLSFTLGSSTAHDGSFKASADGTGFVFNSVHLLKAPVSGKSLATITLQAEQRHAEPFTRVEFKLAAEPGMQLNAVDVGCRLFASQYNQFVQGGGKTGVASCIGQDCLKGLSHDGTSWVALSEHGNRFGEAHASFVRLENSNLFQKADLRVSPVGKLNEVVLHHFLGEVAGGTTSGFGLKLVHVAGHFYSDVGAYSEVISELESPKYSGLDLSLSYDIGAEMNGVASAYASDCARLDKHGGDAHTCVPTTGEWIKSNLNTYLTKWVPAGIFSRGAAFVLLACDKMLSPALVKHVSDEHVYANGIKTIATQVIPKSFDINYLDDIVSVLMAHVVTYRRFSSEAWAQQSSKPVVNSLLQKLKIGAQTRVDHFPNTPQGPQTKQPWGIYVDIPAYSIVDNMVWIFKPSLVARTIRLALATPGLVDLGNVQHANSLMDVGEKYIFDCVNKEYPKQWQVKTCYVCGETNSETQSWAVLGILPTCAFV